MQDSHIEWTHHTFNPWIGCTRVSEECLNCYAEDLDKRYGYTRSGWGKGAPRKFRSDSAWHEPVRWNEDARISQKRVRVFCASLADVFDAEVPKEWRRRLFDLIAFTPWIDWQLLTKRPQLIRRQLEEIGIWDRLPILNVWIGFSAGNQRAFNTRWPHIRELPALVRFCSYEPALGPLVLPEDCRENLHWLICGGETTRRKGESRPMLPAWSRDLRDQCEGMEIPFFFKQWGNWIPGENSAQQWFGKSAAYYRENGHRLDGATLREFPVIKRNCLSEPVACFHSHRSKK